ncbi:universal stress protein [Natrinema sp. SYSU A 869]|uniref:universal stress protein n=1 Tax=Natrinema sp. SYSU A 869 TaxID=2871694 RepID=UPI001CA3A11C|nr:universal stress protein [Natrinema sp. SYSU A 869]
MNADSADGGNSDISGLKTILLAVSGSDENRVDDLVDVIKEIALPVDAAVTVVYMFDSDSHKETIQNISKNPDEYIGPDELASQMTVVEAIADRLEEASIDYEVRAATGTKGDSIVNIAAESNTDRVVIGGQSRSPTGKALFGSRVQKVLLNAPCPVTFIREQERR